MKMEIGDLCEVIKVPGFVGPVFSSAIIIEFGNPRFSLCYRLLTPKGLRFERRERVRKILI